MLHVLLIYFLLVCSSYSSLEFSHSNVQSKRILFILNIYSFQHWDVIDEIFSSYRDMCEGGWDVKVHIMTAATWTKKTITWCNRVLFCYRIDSPISFHIQFFNQSVGRRIVDYSRVPISENINDFDYFSYTEDDMILSLGMLESWVYESRKLRDITSGKTIVDKPRCGYKYSCKYSIGFIRFSRKTHYNRRRGHRKEKEDQGGQFGFRTNINVWNESFVTDKNRLEEEPFFDPICIEGVPYITLKTSPHQAMWILSREDILELNQSCAFLSQRWGDVSFKLFSFNSFYLLSTTILNDTDMAQSGNCP